MNEEWQRRAVEGEYELGIGEVLKEAWERTEGSKLHLLGSLFVYFVIAVAVTALFSMLLGIEHDRAQTLNLKNWLEQMALTLLSMPVEIPMVTALMLMGIRRANGLAISVVQLFDYFVIVWPLVFASLLVYLFVFLGFLALLLPGIYLSIAYMFVLPLMAQRGLGIREAMETSRKAVTRRWFTIFFTMFAMGGLTLLSMIPLGLGLIWTLPMGYIVYGVLYTRIFGFDEAAY